MANKYLYIYMIEPKYQQSRPWFNFLKFTGGGSIGRVLIISLMMPKTIFKFKHKTAGVKTFFFQLYEGLNFAVLFLTETI